MPVIQVDLAWLVIVAKNEIERLIAVEVAQRHALGGVAVRVERDGGWGEAAMPVVQVDLAWLA